MNLLYVLLGFLLVYFVFFHSSEMFNNTNDSTTSLGHLALHNLSQKASSSAPANPSQVATNTQMVMNSIHPSHKHNAGLSAVNMLSQQAASPQVGNPTQVSSAAQTATDAIHSKWGHGHQANAGISAVQYLANQASSSQAGDPTLIAVSTQTATAALPFTQISESNRFACRYN